MIKYIKSFLLALLLILPCEVFSMDVETQDKTRLGVGVPKRRSSRIKAQHSAMDVENVDNTQSQTKIKKRGAKKRKPTETRTQATAKKRKLNSKTKRSKVTRQRGKNVVAKKKAPKKKVKMAISKKKPKSVAARGKKKNARASEEDITLKVGKGSRDTGGGPGGHHWSILYQGKRAGKTYINYINGKPLGEHPSIQIYLNKASQGKGIGRVAYRKACEASNYDAIYAYMAKKNIASIKAAQYAGFVDLPGVTRQKLMRWTRPTDGGSGSTNTKKKR